MIFNLTDLKTSQLRNSPCTCDSLFDQTLKASLHRLVPKKGAVSTWVDLGDEGGPFATLDINGPPLLNLSSAVCSNTSPLQRAPPVRSRGKETSTALWMTWMDSIDSSISKLEQIFAQTFSSIVSLLAPFFFPQDVHRKLAHSRRPRGSLARPRRVGHPSRCSGHGWRRLEQEREEGQEAIGRTWIEAGRGHYPCDLAAAEECKQRKELCVMSRGTTQLTLVPCSRSSSSSRTPRSTSRRRATATLCLARPRCVSHF